MVDLEKIKTVHHIGEREPWVRASDLEAYPEVAEVEGFKKELKKMIVEIGTHMGYVWRDDILTIIDSMPTPVIRKEKADEKTG